MGCPTLFVRFAECDLRCSWCDTPESWHRAKQCRVQATRGRDAFEDVPNPVGLAVLDALWQRLAPRPGHWASLTGGEPLLQAEVVHAWAVHLRGLGARTHLETHGLAVNALGRVVDAIDHVSMDWKFDSDVKAAKSRRLEAGEEGRSFGELHEAFLATASAATSVNVKAVITPATRPAELVAMCEGIARTAPSTPLILQPVTPRGAHKEPLGAEQVIAHLALCEGLVSDVRVIPQTHRIYGAL